MPRGMPARWKDESGLTDDEMSHNIAEAARKLYLNGESYEDIVFRLTVSRDRLRAGVVIPSNLPY